MGLQENSIEKANITSDETSESESSANIEEESPQGEDCFRKFGIVSKRRSESELDQDQPAKLTEHIDAIISLLIYHTYSRKHQSKSYRRYRVSFTRKLKISERDLF